MDVYIYIMYIYIYVYIYICIYIYIYMYIILKHKTCAYEHGKHRAECRRCEARNFQKKGEVAAV